MTDAFDLGGNSGRSFSFGPQGSQPGAFVSGIVVDLKEVQETNFDTGKPEFWDNGDPKMQYRVTLQTDLRDPADPNDDGHRNVYLNGYRKPHPKSGTSGTLWAVIQAVRAATGSSQLQKGGKLTLQWVSGMGFTGDPRHYQAWYEAPAMSLDGGAQAVPATPPGVPAAAPQPAAAPPVATPPAAAPAPAAPAAPPAPAPVPTEQGPVNPATGEIAQASGPVYPPGVTPEAVAAVRAAGVDPATAFPGYRD